MTRLSVREIANTKSEMQLEPNADVMNCACTETTRNKENADNNEFCLIGRLSTLLYRTFQTSEQQRKREAKYVQNWDRNKDR